MREIARVLDIEALLDRKPRELSGGQRQRVAMGRAIVRDPRVFLMDEPLSNLDARLRVQMRGEIVRIQAELGTTTVYVTHDQVEAMTMGQRVAVMEAAGAPVRRAQAALRRPANTFVARFMGSPPMSLLRGKVAAGRRRAVCSIGAPTLALPAELERARPALRALDGGDVTSACGRTASRSPRLEPRQTRRSVVHLAELLGTEVLVHVGVGARPASTAPARGSTGRFAGSAATVPGEAVAVAIDPARLDFFDSVTGDALPRVDDAA